MRNDLEKLYRKVKLFQIFSFCSGILGVAVLFLVGFVLKFQLIIAFFSFSICYLAFAVFMVRQSQKIWNTVHDILWEQVDLDGYYSFFTRFLKGKRKGSLKFYWGLTEYFRGHFDIAEASLSKLTLQDFLPRGRKAAVNQVYAFRLLSAIGLGDDATFEKIADDAVAYNVHHGRMVAKLRVYKAIAEGKAVEDVPLLNEKHLNRILHTYYCAKNALNSGNPDQARAFFESIKDDNPELFMVQEAREYLEKN